MSCTVTETLNGEWELTLVHDIDERGKWTRLSEGCILRAPVPAAMTPSVGLVTQQYQTSTYDVQIYKVTTKSGPLHLRLVVDAAKDEALDATGEAVAQIALTAEQIRSEVKRDYATADQVSQMNETLSTLAEQSENNFTWTVTKVNEIIEDAAANDNLTREQLNLIHTYMRFGEDGLTIGKAGNPLTFRVVNDRLAFYMNDTEVAYLSDNKLYVTQAEILARMQIGKFAYEPQPNGNLSVIYTG